jgi:hypothetical protein
MKSAIFYQDGTAQVVLTPEDDTDKIVLRKIKEYGSNIKIYEGSFYGCQGGWIRMSERSSQYDESIIIRFDGTDAK